MGLIPLTFFGDNGDMKKRKAWLLFLVPLLIPAALTFRRKVVACSSKVEVTIGDYSSLAKGQRAAIRQLSSEIKRCPKAQIYTVRRNDSIWKRWDEANLEITIYWRKEGRLQDGAPALGAYTQWSKVTDAAIHNVANTSGNFNDFAKFGGEYDLP